MYKTKNGECFDLFHRRYIQYTYIYMYTKQYSVYLYLCIYIYILYYLIRGDDTSYRKKSEVSIGKWYIALKMPLACIPREIAA